MLAKGLLLIGVVSLCISHSYAQYSFLKRWDVRLGGTKYEGDVSVVETQDSGFTMLGYSQSGLGGDKTQNSWDADSLFSDYWMVKVNSAGLKVWDKRFGGTAVDVARSLVRTEDGGYILGGHSESNNNGDKSQPHLGGGDFWIVKTDALGNKLWDKRYGGNATELFQNIIATKDGGFIMGGYSTSGISGEKSEGNRDPSNFYGDYWVVKIDSLGTKQWDKRYGGLLDDFLSVIVEADDGGYILGGWSYSNAGGDKTENNWDSVHQMTADYWIVKIDSMGTKQWDKRYGTPKYDKLGSIATSGDGNYLIIGSTADTGANGDKSVFAGGTWMIKIDNHSDIMWQRSFEMGSSIEKKITPTTDHGYLITELAYRNDFLVGIPPDRTENTMGEANALVAKLDSLGQKEWDKVIFTGGLDGLGVAFQTNDGCYAFACSSNAGIGGYKSQSAWNGSYDWWLLKFCMQEYSNVEAGYNIMKDRQIQVYPNPFTSEISISLKNTDSNRAFFTITNLAGQTLYQKQETNLARNYIKMLDLSYLPKGVYVVTVEEVGGECKVKQVVKQ